MYRLLRSGIFPMIGLASKVNGISPDQVREIGSLATRGITSEGVASVGFNACRVEGRLVA